MNTQKKSLTRVRIEESIKEVKKLISNGQFTQAISILQECLNYINKEDIRVTFENELILLSSKLIQINNSFYGLKIDHKEYLSYKTLIVDEIVRLTLKTATIN